MYLINTSMLSERKFVNQLIPHLKNENYFVKTEINSGYGIPDVVMVKLNKNKVQKRQNYKQKKPLLSENYFKLLEIIPDFDDDKNFPIELNEILSKAPLSASYIRYNLLKTLEVYKYIKKCDNNSYLKINGWAPIADEIIAVEAKLTDWKHGLKQAHRYKFFADKVYLAMPENKVHLVPIELLKELKIGLMSFNEKKDNIKYIYKPNKDNRYILKAKRSFITEYFWTPYFLKRVA